MVDYCGHPKAHHSAGHCRPEPERALQRLGGQAAGRGSTRPDPAGGKLELMLKSGLFRGDSGLAIVLVFVAFLGAVNVLTRTAIYGIGQSGDANTYMEHAESLAAGDGFQQLILSEQVFDTLNLQLLDYNSYLDELILWPPLLPVVLASFGLLGVEPAEAGRYLNAVSFGLIILIAGHWLYRHIRSRLIVVAASIAVMISFPLPRVSSHVMTEALFILVTLLALVQIESFLSGRTAKTGFLLSIVSSASAPLIRWIGFTVITTGILLILTRQGTPAQVRLKRAAFYGAASSLPLALWLIRNWIVSGTLTGPREDFASGQSFWDTLRQFGDILYTWAFVRQEPGWLGICLWAVAALITLKAATLFTSRRTMVVTLQRNSGSDNSTVRPAFPFAAFAIVYSIALIVIAPYGFDHEIINRYASPVYVPAVIAVAAWMDRFLLTAYQGSGISVWKSLDGWGIHYDKSSGPMAVIKWLFVGLILNIFLANSIRNIVSHIDVFITYSPLNYQF